MEIPALLFMLPDLCKRLWRRLLSFCCVVCLALSLSACGAAYEPPRQQLLLALSLQIQLTQAAISRSLQLPDVNSAPAVSRVRIEDQQQIRIGAVLR